VAPTLAGEQQQDAVARTVLNNAPPVWSSNDLVANNTGTTGLLGTAENLVKGGLAAGGVLTASALFSVTMTAVLQALPMVQALLLLGVYALLPLVVVLSRYSLSMMVIGAMAIFTVKFWSVLWYLAMWVDQNLIQSMYPDVNVFLQIFANPGEHDTKRMLLNMITTSLYLGLPLSRVRAVIELSFSKVEVAATCGAVQPVFFSGRVWRACKEPDRSRKERKDVTRSRPQNALQSRQLLAHAIVSDAM